MNKKGNLTQEELSQEAKKPFDFIALEFSSGFTTNEVKHDILWIKNRNGEANELEAIFAKNKTAFEKNSIYYIVNEFHPFVFKGVRIERKDGYIFLNEQNLTQKGNATLDEDGVLQMGHFYKTFF